MVNYLKQGVTLLLVCAVAAGILTFVNNVTEPVILEAQQEASYGMYYEIFGDRVDGFDNIDEDQLTDIQSEFNKVDEVIEAKMGDETVGYVLTVFSNGFGGEMKNALALDLEGNILGFRNISHGETPGYGAVIVDEEYYSLYDEGKNISGVDAMTVGSGGETDVEVISGSTVTTNGIEAGLSQVAGAYNGYLLGE